MFSLWPAAFGDLISRMPVKQKIVGAEIIDKI
jgi:hypothetical protein